ncbi:MAG TPA: arylsulfatase [Bacteroidetes bacterium]|nr:arylsulfatase [Bacteroidota bacterium]
MKSNFVDRRKFLKTCALSAASFSLFGIDCTAGKTERPNIVYILADDLGYGDVGCLNPECKIPTPNINRLAARGIRFTDAHSGSAVCTPTRYGILTGRYAWRTRLQSGVLWGYSRALIDKRRMTVASFLKKHGYTTGCIGKWHLGWNWALKKNVTLGDRKEVKFEEVDFSAPITNGPSSVGFDYSCNIPGSLDMVPYVYVENDHVVELPTVTVEGRQNYQFYRSGPAAPGFKHENVLPELTQKAVQFIERQTPAKPFFLYFPLSAPHTPILPTKEFQGKTGLGPYGDFVVQCDWTVGQILQTLQRKGFAENTLVIFTSDNGCSPMANFKHLSRLGHFPSYHFRGYKADIFEGGHRIPFLARWPGKIKPNSQCDDLICLTDLLATTADILGKKLPDYAGEDSISILPDLLGTAKKPVREAIVHHSINGSFSVRRGKWKLELCPGSGGWSDPRPQKAAQLGLPMVQLYDLTRDIGEQNNLQYLYPDVVYRLTRLLERYVVNGRSTPGKLQKNDVEINIWKMQKLRQ